MSTPATREITDSPGSSEGRAPMKRRTRRRPPSKNRALTPALRVNTIVRMRKILVLALSITISSLLVAQAPPAASKGGGKGAAKGGGRGAPAVPGYEVSADRKVTFRLRAPEVSTVTVAGDFATGAQTMTKGQDGVWTLTLGPLRPAIYNYRFTVN